MNARSLNRGRWRVQSICNTLNETAWAPPCPEHVLAGWGRAGLGKLPGRSHRPVSRPILCVADFLRGACREIRWMELNACEMKQQDDVPDTWF